MLVLTRKTGEWIRLGDAIEISIIQVQGSGVKLGIRAPRSVPVLRSELIEPAPTQSSNGSPESGSAT